MRLRVWRPLPYSGGPVILRKVSGAVKFWKTPTKGDGQELVPGAGGTVEIDVWQNGFPGDFWDLWVEATAPSGALRDIVLKVEYGESSDTVKATGVWAEIEAVEHDVKSYDQLFSEGTPWHDAPDGFKELIEPYGGSGVRPFDPTTPLPPAEENLVVGIANVIMFKWVVTLAGIGKQVGPYGGLAAYFDVTRRKEAKAWKWEGGGGPTPATQWESNFPLHNEKPNDDGEEDDEFDNPEQWEENDPEWDDRLYNRDRPGIPEKTMQEDRVVIRTNFEEFVRVGFLKGQPPIGNDVRGSRTSDRYLWHSRLDVKRLSTPPYHLERHPNTVDASGDPVETASNDIGPPHLSQTELTTPPT